MKQVSRLAAVFRVLVLTAGVILPWETAAQDRPVAGRVAGVPAPLPEPRIADPRLQATEEEIPDWQARWELARLLSYVKRYDDSIAAYGLVLKEKPDLLEAQIELANVFLWSGRHKAARESLEKIPIEKLDDKSVLVLGDAYAAEKQYDQAKSVYQRLLARRPDDHAVRLRLAEVLSWQKEYEASITEYRKVLAAQPDDIQIRRKYAFVLSWAGRHPEAIAELKKTLTD